MDSAVEDAAGRRVEEAVDRPSGRRVPCQLNIPGKQIVSVWAKVMIKVPYIRGSLEFDVELEPQKALS